ncbi:MAG: hypothetical protein LKF52_00340 [Butyrivibrio sp.]|jgi:flagellar basal body-associated protein FliL|nr:hypothetical protein [Butyrivibrio sp.]
MRHTNQTVSLRDLVKKMKHHSTRTILLTAIITLLLSAGLIYLMFPTQDVKAEEEKPVSTAVIPQQTDMADQLKEIMTYLKKLDVQVNTNQKGLEEIRKIQEDTEKNGEKTAEQKAAEREISELGTSMTTLQDQITQTGTQITALQSLLESGQKENQDKLNQKFTEITDALMKISQNYSDTQTKTEMLIKDMEGSSDARHEETLRQLKEMQTGLESVDTRNLTDMTARLKEMESSWQKQMADLAGEVNGNITDLNQKISSQMEDMNMTISNQYSELLRQSGGKDDEILGRISEMNQTVNSRMDQVFQRVSD